MRTASKLWPNKASDSTILSIRPRRGVVRASLLLTMAMIGLVGGLQVVKTSQKSASYGYVGVLGGSLKAHQTGCGLAYSPDDLVIASETLPCGVKVVVVNPESGQKVAATVVSTDLALLRGRRMADVSPAVAKAVGVSPNGKPVPLLVRRADGWHTLTAHLPVQHDWLPQLPPLPYFTRAQHLLLAKLMWFEARGHGNLGMVATGVVTLNRLRLAHNGRETLEGVVLEPHAYQWVLQPQTQRFDPNGNGKIAMEVAERLLTGRLLADELALATRLGNADHFHARSMGKYPAWAGRLARVDLGDALETKLGHVFYVSRRADGYQLASR